MPRALNLDTPVQYLRGVGPKRAACLARLGVNTMHDLLLLVPRRYLDRTKLSSLTQLKPGQDAVVWGKVVTSRIVPTRYRGELVVVRVAEGPGYLDAIWFHRPDLKSRFNPGQEVILSGRVSCYRGLRLVNPQFQLIDPNDEKFQFSGSIVPIYPLTEGLRHWELRRLIRTAVQQCASQIPESLPNWLLEKAGYDSISKTVSDLHFPPDISTGVKARDRLAFEELFYLELILALRRRRTASLRKGTALPESGLFTKRLRDGLPFELTAAQTRVLDEIRRDLAAPTCMNRLLLGDVGSGKTVIAILALLIAVENGVQGALMAPTEILAEQHYEVWHNRLEEIGVRSELLTSGLSSQRKKAVVEAIATHECDLVFGTHALIEGDVRFDRLGVVVVDEQHRFGVLQRAALLNKGLSPDFLVMTATPIPRTIALTLYGDLDISIIDEKPPGRRPVTTKLVNESRRPAIYDFVRQQVALGQQAFIVCPLIEESEKLDIAAATKTYESVRKILTGINVGLLHGRLVSEERSRVMSDFREGRIMVLVTTTVIEVGVDIPRATVMIIEHPERFGLAQLHQLRGRVGRGGTASYCILIAPWLHDPVALERLRFFTQTDDGFRLAEKDLELRGPGSLLGTRQHGLPDLRIADIIEDRELLLRARAEAFALVDSNPDLSGPENYLIRQTIESRFKERIELLRVG